MLPTVLVEYAGTRGSTKARSGTHSVTAQLQLRPSLHAWSKEVGMNSIVGEEGKKQEPCLEGASKASLFSLGAHGEPQTNGKVSHD